MGTIFVPKEGGNTNKNTKNNYNKNSELHVLDSGRKIAWIVVGLVVGSVTTFIAVNYPMANF